MAASQWVFPPPTTSPTFFNTSILNTNLAIYLNASTSAWPSTGFGRTPTFDYDAIRFEWPSSSNLPPTRNWHCLPCRQLSSSTNESANWEACGYPAADALPELLSVSVPIQSQGNNHYTWNLNLDTSLPRETRTLALMCTFGVPSDNGPYYITRPFRFTNADRQRATGENFYIFNASAPEGAVSQAQRDDRSYFDHWSWSSDGVIGIIIATVVVLIGLLAGLLYLINRKKKQRKAVAAMLAPEPSVSAAENGAAGVSTKEKKEKRIEGETEEELPRYEGPPAYAETATSSASASSAEATTSSASASFAEATTSTKAMGASK
ncbi:hypothetical protein J1614_006173 [Plenodomus biglobosus]|nr:hypothetical protein J1614_006173 [Plenodomus biglobosus]